MIQNRKTKKGAATNTCLYRIFVSDRLELLRLAASVAAIDMVTCSWPFCIKLTQSRIRIGEFIINMLTLFELEVQ